MTNVPNLFRNDPPQSTQTGRGNVRSVAIIPGLGALMIGSGIDVAWFIKTKNPANLSVGRGENALKILHCAPLPMARRHLNAGQTSINDDALAPGKPAACHGEFL